MPRLASIFIAFSLLAVAPFSYAQDDSSDGVSTNAEAECGTFAAPITIADNVYIDKGTQGGVFSTTNDVNAAGIFSTSDCATGPVDVQCTVSSYNVNLI